VSSCTHECTVACARHVPKLRSARGGLAEGHIAGSLQELWATTWHCTPMVNASAVDGAQRAGQGPPIATPHHPVETSHVARLRGPGTRAEGAALAGPAALLESRGRAACLHVGRSASRRGGVALGGSRGSRFRGRLHARGRGHNCWHGCTAQALCGIWAAPRGQRQGTLDTRSLCQLHLHTPAVAASGVAPLVLPIARAARAAGGPPLPVPVVGAVTIDRLPRRQMLAHTPAVVALVRPREAGWALPRESLRCHAGKQDRACEVGHGS